MAGLSHLAASQAFGAFTYWSVRAGNRKSNRGLRLDYALVSEALVCDQETSAGTWLWDAFHLPSVATGDHCPVGVTLAVARPLSHLDGPLRWIRAPLSRRGQCAALGGIERRGACASRWRSACRRQERVYFAAVNNELLGRSESRS